MCSELPSNISTMESPVNDVQSQETVVAFVDNILDTWYHPAIPL